MPISSGALEWPASYYNRPDREAMEVIEGGTTAGKKSPRDGYEWTPQLSSREDYEKWRRKMDRKVGLRLSRLPVCMLRVEWLADWGLSWTGSVCVGGLREIEREKSLCLCLLLLAVSRSVCLSSSFNSKAIHFFELRWRRVCFSVCAFALWHACTLTCVH